MPKKAETNELGQEPNQDEPTLGNMSTPGNWVKLCPLRQDELLDDEMRSSWFAGLDNDDYAETIALGMDEDEKRIVGLCSIHQRKPCRMFQAFFLERRGTDLYLNGDVLYKLAGMSGLKTLVAGIVERLMNIGALIPERITKNTAEVIVVNNHLLNVLKKQLYRR